MLKRMLNNLVFNELNYGFPVIYRRLLGLKNGEFEEYFYNLKMV